MYRELAEVYDRIYRSKDYAHESEIVRSVIRRHNPEARTLLDVACGTGGHLVHLREHFECQGIDLSDEMIRIAGRKVPGVPLHTGDMTNFDLGERFDAVVCLFSAVGHLATVERLHGAVSRMAAHVAPGGILVIEPWIDAADWIVGRVGMDTVQDEDMKIARIVLAEPVERGRMVMEFLVGTNAGVTRLRDEHEMGWFTGDEYRAAFQQAGLNVRFEEPGLTGRGLYIGTA